METSSLTRISDDSFLIIRVSLESILFSLINNNNKMMIAKLICPDIIFIGQFHLRLLRLSPSLSFFAKHHSPQQADKIRMNAYLRRTIRLCDNDQKRTKQKNYKCVLFLFSFLLFLCFCAAAAVAVIVVVIAIDIRRCRLIFSFSLSLGHVSSHNPFEWFILDYLFICI